jgi:hypothetical protein
MMGRLRQLLLPVQQLGPLLIQRLNRFYMVRCVSLGAAREFIDRDNYGKAKLSCIFDMFCHIHTPTFDKINVLGAVDIGNG